MMKTPAPSVPLPLQQSGESNRDYARFVAFCLAPPAARSVDGVYRAEATKGGNEGKKKQPPGSIYRAAERWDWRQRVAEYDEAVAALEATEIEAARRKARKDRAALVEKFVARVSMLLDDPAILANMPAGTATAVLRAVECSHQVFGADVVQKERGSDHRWSPKSLPSPILEVWVDNGNGQPQPLSSIGEPDTLNSEFDPIDGTIKPVPVLPGDPAKAG